MMKKNENLAVEIVVEPGGGDEREVRCVQHDFERHVDDKQVAPDQNAQQAERKQQGADNQIMMEADVGHYDTSLLLSRITPIIATSSKIETISKGSRYCVKSNLPSGAVAP